MEEKEKKKFKLIDLFRNKQYYAILNLVFYFILILVLIIGVRTTSNSSTNIKLENKTNKIGSSVVEGFDNIKKRNFEFKYTLELDDKKIVYEGREYNNKVSFKDLSTNKQYLIQDDITIEKQGNQSVLVSSPVQYFNYLDTEIIERILSKTRKDEEDYIISMNDFLSIVEENYNPENKNDNEMFINLNKKNGIITQISMEITDFVNMTTGSIKKANLTLEYFDFGVVDDIEIK